MFEAISEKINDPQFMFSVLIAIAVQDDGGHIQGAGTHIDEQQVAALTVGGIYIPGELGCDFRIKVHP